MNRVQIFAIKDIHAFLADPVFREYSGFVDPSACIVLSSMDGLDHCVGKGVIEAVCLPPYTEDERTVFIHDYTEFIASLNLSYKEKFFWWATDISSKNRYTSPLPDLLQELLEIEQGIQACSGKPLLVVAPSMALHGALCKVITKHHRKLFWPGAAMKASIERTKGAVESFLRNLVRAVRFYGRSLLARLALRQHAVRWLSTQKRFYVIKTFSYHSSWDNKGNYTDSFFGHLPQTLSKDHNVLIVSYHWQGFREFIKNILHQKEMAIFPVEFFLTGSDILRALWRILIFRVPVKSEVYFRDLDVSDILCFELARTANGIQIFQLLHYDALRCMLKKLSIEIFLFTFENNPWERMCMLACRHHSSSIKVIGYQHNIVPEAALNMFVHPLEKNIVPLPDKILTTGETPKNILEHYADYGQVPIISACASRYGYLFSIKPPASQKSQGHILLVLDGVEQTQLMLRFVLGQWKDKGHYQLRIRCHPALPWSLLSKKFRFDISHYVNVEVSKGTLKEDIEWSDMFIYWQTTVVLEAMSWGKPAINFKSKDILSYDPLFQSDALKWTVTEEDCLLDAITAIELMDEISYQQQLKEALIYIKKYFHPESPLALELFK